jgi:hypothetical protein
MNLQESIKRILREETEVPIFIRRRFTPEDLEWLINDIKELIDYGESLDTAIYDGTREFIKSRKFSDIDEFGDDSSYWSSYLNYERPLVKYAKNKLGILESVNENEMTNKNKLFNLREKYQTLVGYIIKDMKSTCEIMNSEDNEIISFGACELIDADVKVSVSEIGIVNDRQRVLVVIKYHHWRYIDKDEFVYELSKELRKWIGDSYVEVEDYLNTYPPEKRQW